MMNRNSTRVRIAMIGVAMVWFGACEGVGKIEYYDMIDLHPPELERVQVLSATSIEFCFDETVELVTQSLHLSLPLELDTHGATECGLALNLRTAMKPGKGYAVSATVMDDNGNSLDILTNVYGYNDRVPRMVINEFTTRGSSRHPDVVELYLHTGGNVGGVTLYEGSPDRWESRKILPSLELPAHSYILVHFKPQGIDAEEDELTSPDSSAGLDVHELAWDLWVPEGNGLSGNNGVLTMSASPNGELLDAVLYTNRTSSSDTKYRGFGSANALAYAEGLQSTGQWHAETEGIRPEDAVFVDRTTATRSICRGSDGTDTDGKGDWHIVPTSQYSFGEQNSDNVYEK